MEEKAKISVIVPVYGVEEYLDECVRSIVEQTYRNLEIILVDDGSPDLCPQMCDVWAAKDSRIRVIHKSNGGLSEARNTGLAASRGDYVMYADSDDMLEKDIAEHLIKLAEMHGAQIAVSTYRIAGERTVPQSDPVISGSGEEILAELYGRGLWQSWGKLIRSDIAKAQPFENVLYEDYEHTPRIFLMAEKAVLSMDGRYIYRRRSGSIMDECGAYGTEFLDITARIWEMVRGSGTEQRMQKELLANAAERYNRIVRSGSREDNAGYTAAVQKTVRRYRNEWQRNPYIIIRKKIAYYLLGSIPRVYEGLVGFSNFFRKLG